MSFFGFDTSLPRDRGHNSGNPGFGPVPDAFADLSLQNAGDDGEVLDFEDTYDGLGDELDDANDDFNTETFGSPGVTKDFDFSGQTAQMSNQLQYSTNQSLPKPQLPKSSPLKAASQPKRTGYEAYAEPNYIPNLEASASIWGTQPTRDTSFHQPKKPALSSVPSDSKRMMSLEEVEAAMRAQNQRPTSSRSPQPPLPDISHAGRSSHAPHSRTDLRSQPQAPQILQRPQQAAQTTQYDRKPQPDSQAPSGFGQQNFQRQHSGQPMTTQSMAAFSNHASQNLLRSQSGQSMPQQTQRPTSNQGFQQPRPPQNGPQLQSMEAPRAPQIATMHNRVPSYNGAVVTHPEQLLHLSEQERAAFIEEDAKRAKRNHKIYLLSKDNGLMTPQDKNFITRIQLQQLLTATGNVEEQESDAALFEDFYYQVYSQIRGAPNHPTNHFAQTYLHQMNGRTGNRRYPRGGDSQMKRMEQQVQRAVEAAKLKPKNKQLVIEGTLGKISFSNAKTPKPLLNITQQAANEQRPQSATKNKRLENKTSTKAVLKDIEDLYAILMKMEDHERRMPPPNTEESSADEIQEQIDWRARIQELNETVWNSLKVLEPIDESSSTIHPFIAILSHPKGKKAIPRVFRQIVDQQRLTILTMIVIHLHKLDVTRLAIPQPNEVELPQDIQDSVNLWSNAVMPSLFSYTSEAQLGIVVGLVGLVIDRVDIPSVIQTKIGVGILTMLLSRAELIKQTDSTADESDKEQWKTQYNRLFDILEPNLTLMFTLTRGEDDMYIWQFLAALGIGASPEQQQRLVLAVKDQVMDTVNQAKSMLDGQGKSRLENVNLFMRAIGLDVEWLS